MTHGNRSWLAHGAIAWALGTLTGTALLIVWLLSIEWLDLGRAPDMDAADFGAFFILVYTFAIPVSFVIGIIPTYVAGIGMTWLFDQWHITPGRGRALLGGVAGVICGSTFGLAGDWLWAGLIYGGTTGLAWFGYEAYWRKRAQRRAAMQETGLP